MCKSFLRFVFISFWLLLLSSCITTRKVNYLQEPDNIIPAYADSLVYEDYRLKIGDKIYLRVYSTHEETNALFNSPMMLTSTSSPATDLYSYTIQKNGSIVLPMVGEVAIVGLTTREAVRTVEAAIEPFFLHDSTDAVCTVELHVLAQYFSVIGGNGTGQYPITRAKINIFEALAMAGDVGTFADRSKVRIIRETEDGTVVKMFDLRSKSILNSEYYYIEPNDVIYIQRLDEQFFSIVNLPNLIATVLSTVSLGTFLYRILLVPKKN
ncbi:MAG: Polysaccharide biosynthesis/export protein [Bacteroidetes bacterium ADurb.Bin174]|jgi:polysaccharide export outer membrane protein|nr:MAG: Polysaccharide biosynthesis/export protein [Bacteroidetes bacterium ADurb.Bin174]